MYLSHLIAGLAQPPALRVDTTPWTEAEWAAQAWLEEQEARATPPRAGGAPVWVSCLPNGGRGLPVWQLLPLRRLWPLRSALWLR